MQAEFHAWGTTGTTLTRKTNTMSAIDVQMQAPDGRLGLKGLMSRHPLVSYCVLAFAFTWVVVSPLVLSQRGLGVITLPDALLMVAYILATFTGPLPAALIVTHTIEGKSGIKQLLRRMVQWRIGIQWILIALIGYPVIFLVGVQIVLGSGPLRSLISNPLILLTSYLPMVLMGIIFPSLGEEPGWRGFALPRLQQQYGPLAGSLILGALHALWHLPVYFVAGAITEGGFNTVVFVANSLAIIASSFVWTWLFNGAKGSVLFAMFVHGISNATSVLIGSLLPEQRPDAPFFAFGVMLATATVVIALTRGKLAYQPAESD